MSSRKKPKSMGCRLKPRSVPAEGDEIEDLAEGDRHHGEIDAAPPRDERAERRAGDDAEQHAEGDGEWRAGRQQLQRQPGAVGAEAEIGGMAEGQYAGEAEEEIERHGAEAEYKHAGAERLVAVHERQPKGRGEEGKPDGGEVGAQLHDITPSSPISPRGRTSKTTAMMT